MSRGQGWPRVSGRVESDAATKSVSSQAPRPGTATQWVFNVLALAALAYSLCFLRVDGVTVIGALALLARGVLAGLFTREFWID